MAEQLLYEVVLHGVGWRLEQEESADMVLGWRTRRELHEGDDVDDDAPRSAIEENSAGQIVTALQQRDARALLRHLLPHRLVALSLWLLRDGATILAQLEGRRAGLVHALERRHAQLPEWQLALCHGGEILAIWRTEELVVLSSRDNFASPVALWAAPADSKPHCRLLAWSPDDSLLAAATSDGTVHVLDARARLLHRLPPTSWGLPAAHGSLSGAEVGHAITGMAFRSSRQREGGDAALLWELLLLSCDAVLHRISIPSVRGHLPTHAPWEQRTRSRQHQPSHAQHQPSNASSSRPALVYQAAATTVHGTTPSRSTSPPVLLGAHHGMVSCMSYDQNHGLLAVGGGGGCASLQASLLRAKQDPASPPLALPSLSIWALRDRPPFSSLIFTTTTNASSAVPVAAAMRRLWMRAHAVLRGTGVPSAVSFCPSGERLSVLTLEGQLTVWDTEPLVTASRAEGTLSSGMPELPLVLSEGEPLDKCIICTGWWDDSSIILATRLGAVSICRLPQLQNLLGAPHPFAAGSALSTAQNNSLFVLEREIQPIAEQERATAATTHPQRRVQSWRLISLRQTSPEVLFERKVALREYEAALQWAHLYGMSEDPVRQAQWRESEVTAASINSYLAKVTSLRWVLDECCHRVPPDPHDLELLLNFGRDRAKATLRSTGEGSAAPQEHDLSRVEIEEFILRLARYSTRLKTSLRLSEAEGRTGFDVEAFVMLRDVAMSDFAHEMAAQERFSTLEVLIKSHKEELDHLRLDLLRSVPETTPPSNYAFLIAPIAAEALQAHSGAAAGSRSIDAASLCEWFCLRAREIDERSGALDNAEELLQLAVSLGLGAHVRQMLATVQLLSSLVYRLDCTASLAEFESFSEQQRIALLFSLAPPWAGERADHAFHDFCRQHVKPFLRLQRRGPRLLREYAIRLAVEDSPHALHLCAALVHLSGHERPVEERLLRPQSLLIDTALRCIYGSPRADDEALELMTAMYKALPGRDVALSTAEDESDEEEADEENSEAREHEESSSAPGHSQLPLLLDQLDALEQHLSAQYELRDYGMLQRMSDYLQGERGLDAERGHKLLRAMARHTGRRSPPASSGVWLQTRDDMVQLRDQACSQLPSELAYCEWLQALLLAAEFRLAADFLRAQTSSTPLLGMDTAERLVLMAAREYFNSAPSSADSSVEHAEKCLRVLPLASGEVEAELNLVKAVRLLATFGCELLPLQVRMHPDRRKLVVELVRSCSAATARLADFEQLAEALGLKSGSDRAAIAEAVAWKALDEGDQRCAVQLALQLVSERHGSSWSLCDVLLARCGDARSASSPGGGAPSGERADGTLEPRTRQKLLSHALAHCDPDRFEPLMQLWRDWRDEQTTASLRAQADSLSMHSSEESMAAMKSVAALHQDYQTLHEIKKAISDGLTFREWMQLNESADVTADGFTERVNRNDFRARYWAEAGGVFSPSEQRHLSSTRAADPPADDPERVRMRHMFNRSPVAAQASQIEETEATLKAVIGCVTGEEQSENMDATLEPAAARRALLRSRLLLIEAQPRPCSDAVKQVERSIRIELFRGCLRGKLAALSQAAADGNFDAFEEPSEGSISADENAMNRQAIIDLSLESEPEIALALSSQMWDESTVELTVTTLWRRIRAAAGTGGVDSVRSISEMGAWACARMAIVLRDPSKEAAERLRRAESLAELLPMVIRDGKSREGIAGLLHSHLDGFLEVLRELETAERLAATLPEIDCAQFATDRSARTRTCVELACTQVDGALQDALEIARRVGMDEWELRMACVRAALVERNEGGAPADLSEWRSRLRDTLAQHDQHLLQYPTRLSRALVLDVLPAVAAQPVPMDAVMQLMLEGENKQRADQKVSVARSAVSPTLLNHNLLLLLSTRAVFRYLRKAAASIDPRDLLRLGCDFEADGFIKLSLCAAPQAASTLEANVNEETTTRLALLMPELSACISQGGGGGAKDPFTPSFVWLAYARRTLLLEQGGAMERTVALLQRLSTEHLVELLLPLEPEMEDLPHGTVPKSGRLALHDLGILLREAQALLRARALAQLVQRKLRATEEIHIVEVAAWRQVKRRRRQLQSFDALARRRTEGTAFSELLLLWAEVNREDKWICEEEAGRPHTFDLLLKYLTSAFGSASQTLEALKIVLPCSSDDTEGRGAMPRLLEMGAQRVLSVLEGSSAGMLKSGLWVPNDTDAAILAMRRILEVGAAAGEAPPTSFLDVVRNEHLNEELRIQMVELLSASWRQLGMDASPDAAATNALKLRLHARRTVASVYPERDDLVEQVSQLPLNTDSGAAAASKLLALALEDESDTARARMRVSAHADLMLEWADNLMRCQQAGTLLPDSSKTPSSLHSEWLSLYCAALEHGGPELLLDVRYTVWNVTRVPMLYETEEEQLVSAVRTHAAHPDADAAATLELACIACFLLSGWSSLEQKALCLLSGEHAAVEPDARLARLLVRQDRLPEIACTSYWETLLPTLGKAHDTVAMAVVSLGKNALFLEAGSVLLNHFRCHPVMISAGAKLAMLSEYVATHCDHEADPSLAHEMRKLASELATLQRQTD